jgi:short-subunit dehydrogenase
LSAVCRALDVELAPRKISVRALEPRHVRTAMFERCAGRMGTDPSSALDPEEFARDVLSGLEN